MNHANQILAHITKAREAEKNVTSGPWKFYTTPQPNGCPIIGNHKGLMVAMLAHSVNEPRYKEEALANAAFMTSSRTDLPKCWEALEAAVEALDSLADPDMHAECYPSHAREVLSKVNSILSRP